MTPGLCDICNDGKVYENLGAHKRHCIKKHSATPLIIKLPDPDFKPNEKATETDKLKTFLADLPIWSGYQEHSFLGWRQFVRGIINPEPIKDIVFVSEDRPPRVAHLPYDPEKNRLFIPEKGYYMTNIKGDFMLVHEDYMLPIINAPSLKDKFQLPAHVVAYAYSAGLAEGKAQSWDKMIAALQGIKYLAYAAAGVALIAIVAYVLSSYETSGSLKLMSTALNNATAQTAQDIVIK